MNSGALDYYELLEVRPDASIEVIEKAYQVLAKRWHPDLCGDTPHNHAMMQHLNEAIAVLRDPRQRSQYDSSRLAAPPVGSGAAPRRGDAARTVAWNLDPPPMRPPRRASAAAPASTASTDRSAGQPRKKWVAVALAVILGGYGAHEFYLGRRTSGAVRLVIYLGCWFSANWMSQTRPTIALLLIGAALFVQAIGVVDGIRYAVIDPETFRQRYG